MASAAMYAISTVSGNQPRIVQIAEGATQTFLFGTPVQLTGGYVVDWDGVTIPKLIGIVRTNGQNLASAGVADPLHYGSVPYQSGALNIPIGQPLAYPKCVVETANEDSVFYGQFETGITAAITDVGVAYGMAKDADNHWYVDHTNIATPVCRVVGISEFDPRGVFFVFIPADVILIN